MLRSFPSLRRKRPVVFKCGLVVLSVTAAVLLTSLLERFMDTIPLFYAAVIISSWYGGLWSGLLSVLLAMLAVDYYFVPPSHGFTLSIATLPYLGSFALLALIVSFLSAARRHAEESLRQAQDEMEAKILERTAAFVSSGFGGRGNGTIRGIRNPRVRQSTLSFVFAGTDWPQSHAVQKPVTNDQCVEQHRA